MADDFSISGRERFLFHTFYDELDLSRQWELNFARWTLLERVIWQFLPNEKTYCHLDGFDSDQMFLSSNGFACVGRVWLLQEPGTPGDIATTLAVKFDKETESISEATIWVGPFIPKRMKAPTVNGLAYEDFFASWPRIGKPWEVAFERDSEGWFMSPHFDLSIFTMPAKEG